MKRLLKEPLLHFLLFGVAIFAAHRLVSKRNGNEPGEIIITRGQIEHLATTFERTWQRPVTPEEMAGLIRDRVRDEVYCREAVALGLDRDDTVIRRRLRQKMEFISDGIAALTEPSDADLEAYLKTHADTFRVEQRFTFQQVYLNPQKHGDKLDRNVAQMLEKLNRAGDKADMHALGDSFLLEPVFDAASFTEIAKQFGASFAAKLSAVQTGTWQGPVESGYGLHLIRISQRTEGRVPALADVRDAVRREWDNDRRLAANEKFYQELLKRYAVTIEEPEPSVAEKKLAQAK